MSAATNTVASEQPGPFWIQLPLSDGTSVSLHLSKRPTPDAWEFFITVLGMIAPAFDEEPVAIEEPPS